MSSNKTSGKELPFNEIIGKLLFERVVNKPFTAMADLAWFRKYLGKHEALFNIPEPVKSDVRSAQLRQEGNRFFREQKYREALARYNEGICYAEPGSQELGLGYANRSAVYYEQAEYEFALANIGLARKHNYPETLAPKLRERELNCQAKLDAGHSRGTVPCPRMGINVETAGPKIPFVANHLRMKITPELGRGVYAKRDFRPGDVLLDERPMMTVMDGKLRYLNCSWCGTENFLSLMPCTECVSYMYCGEECLVRDRETCHRFECGIAGKLREFAYCNTVFGPKLFFYGLSLFKDNVQQMMEFCKAHAQTGGNPLQIDYSKNDQALQEFKEFAKVVPIMKMKHGFVYRFCAAFYDMLFEKHVPLVRSIIKTKAQKNFMLHTIHDFSQLAVMLSFHTDPEGLFINMFPSVASLFNHSCDPNAVIVLDAGRVKIAVLRPIRSGEQICISNGPNFWEPKSEEDDDPDFICKCVVCDPATKAAWLAHARKLPPQAVLHWRVLTKILNQEQGGAANDAAKLNALQQYVQRYAYIHPCPDWTAALHVYQGMLRVLTKKENEALARAAALAAAELLN